MTAQQTTPAPPPAPDGQRGPERFQQRELVQTQRSVPRLIGAVAALLAVVVGVPALLVALHGVPSLPTSLPDRDTLSNALSADQLVGVLVVIAWLAWLQFTVCLVVELVSAVRGRGLPAVVPLSGPSQRLARALVASIIIAAVSAGPAAAATGSGSGPASGGPVASQSVTGGTGASGAASAVDAQAAIDAQAPTGPAATAPTAHYPDEVRELVGQKVYLVKTPEGRYHDNLWDIAEKHLGDGRRYKEIYALNAHREQPDGRTLELARLIQPGWQLVMPDDATGVPRFDAGAHAATATAATTRTLGERSAAKAAERAAASADAGGAAVTADRGGSAVTTTQAAGLAGAGLLAAGLLGTLLAVRRRRGDDLVLDPEAQEAEVALRVGADLERSRSVDRALRVLSAACTSRGLALPAAYAAVVDGRTLQLLLAPASHQAPPGWNVDDEGRSWSVDLDAAEGLADAAGTSAPYPALVGVGRDPDGRDVLIDLDAADGPIVLAGDPGMCGEVAVALGVSLATSPWAEAVRVGVTGLSGEVRAIAPDRLHLVEDAAAAIRTAVGNESGPGGPEVLTGHRSAGADLELLVLAADPGPEALAPLETRAGREVGGLVVAAEVPGATWRLLVDEAGTVEISPLGLSVTGYRLDPATVRALTALLGQARAERAEAALPGDGPGGIGAPVPAQPSDDAAYSAAQARIGVLGVPDVRASGAMDASRIPLATEVLAYLALHRDGVHPTVLGGAVWPRGVGSDVLDATVARVRDWLGTDAQGHHLLRTLPDGRLSLSPDVPSDWDVVCTLAGRADAAQEGREEAELLRRALRVVRGPLLAGVPQGRYSWVVRTRLERTVPRVVAAAAHRLATLHLDGGPDNAGAAMEAARSGLRLDPGAQVLWRDQLRAAYAADGPPGAVAALAEMRSVLADLGEPMEAETEALVEELSPGALADHA